MQYIILVSFLATIMVDHLPLFANVNLIASSSSFMSLQLLTSAPTEASAPVVLSFTLEPPNKGHFGSRHFVLYREAVLWWEVKKSIQVVPWRVSLMRGCPLVGGSIIGGSTVLL